MKREKIHSAGPWITEREIAAATEAAAEGWYGNYRLHIERFEKAFAAYLGVKFALATSSGTGALHLALAASGIGPGDEIIVPDISWVATANVVKLVGAEPVFVDVEPEAWTMDPDTLDAALTPRTKAVFPVHLYGHPADMDPIMDFARRKGLLLLEDSAPAAGAAYKGRLCGTFGLAAGFSFQGAKIMVTGQGGMMVTDDEALYRRAVGLIEHGRRPEKGMFFSAEVGFNYKMPNVCAAIGHVQLQRLPELVARKRLLFDWYAARLAPIEGIQIIKERPDCFSNCSFPTIVIDPGLISRDALAQRLAARNIDTRPLFPRMSSMPAFRKADTPVARHAEQCGLSLPTASYLTEEDVEEICGVIKEAIGGR